ncbi:MAG: DNA primase DnaG [Candidatus Micrarchaeota archaeon]|nr:MAG: DNA primase DnaG [Candidatus Micrarchaeota archaeon]
MAKTYIDIVKYLVTAKFEVKGLVEKPDIIGAIFGQTEGLLGNDLDLKELQKNGKIGRIEVEMQTSNNKTYGRLLLPSSLSLVETAILAAAIETVDRVGPFETTFTIESIQDIRNEKRKRVVERAKELLKEIINNQLPNSKELSELVENEVKSEGIIYYGEEKLPAGFNVDNSDELIIVEGRADIINLLKADVGNCISIGGASSNIPKSIIELSKKKDTTLFIDGDRGGDIILKSLLNNGVDIDYVARAPDGKEVEELTRKEIIKALRSKVPIDTYLSQRGELNNTRKEQKQEEKQEHKEANERKADTEHHEQSSSEKPDSMDVEKLKEILNTSLKNTLRAQLIDPKGNVIEEVPIRDLIQRIQSKPDKNEIAAIVMDGVITQRVVDIAASKGIRYIVGIKRSQINRVPNTLNIVSIE